MYYCVMRSLCCLLRSLAFTLRMAFFNFYIAAYCTLSQLLLYSCSAFFIIICWFWLMFLAAQIQPWASSIILSISCTLESKLNARCSLSKLSFAFKSAISFLYRSICLYPFSNYLFKAGIDFFSLGFPSPTSLLLSFSRFSYVYFLRLNFEVSWELMPISCCLSSSFLVFSLVSLLSVFQGGNGLLGGRSD